MRKTFLAFAIVMFMVALPALAGGNSTHVKVDEFSAAEPLVAFDLDNGTLKLTLMDRMTAGGIDETGTLLRTLEYANPGLLQQMAMEALKRGEAAGILEPGTDYSNLNQGQLDQLNEVLRRLIYEDVRPTMAVAKRAISPDTLGSIGFSLNPSPRDVGDVRRAGLAVNTNWYTRSSVTTNTSGGDLTETTICEPDTGDCGSGGVFCPNQCVAGCDPPSSNCTSVTVPKPEKPVHLQLNYNSGIVDFSER